MNRREFLIKGLALTGGSIFSKDIFFVEKSYKNNSINKQIINLSQDLV